MVRKRTNEDAGIFDIVAKNTSGRWLGVIGEPVVNVLELNSALDEQKYLRRANMKKIGKLLAVLLISCLGLSQLAIAVSWSPLQEEREEKAAKGIMGKGTVVCLFQSGTLDVKKAINMNDILPVYRETKSHELREVGKIKVLSYVREDYLKGEVIEGEIKTGDIAKKGDVASLIISSGDKCN